MQVGYADTVIGELIDRMQTAGIWEDAMLVIFADHGVSFLPDHPRRGPTPDTIDEIYRVPLFIKIPGQTQGGLRDDNAMLIDIMPTIVDVLGIQTDWDFPGRSLFGDDPPPAEKRVIEGPEMVLSNSLDGLLAVAQRNAAAFHFRMDWMGIAAVGEHGHLVGEPVELLGEKWRDDFEWHVEQAPAFEDINPESGYLPVLIDGHTFLPPDDNPPREVLVAVNGIIAGVGGGWQCEAEHCIFSALLAQETLRPGPNHLQLFIPR
jgi:hypothetical protein